MARFVYVVLMGALLFFGCSTTKKAETPSAEPGKREVSTVWLRFYKIKARPKAGFYYDYLLVVPKDLKTKYIFVTPNNSGFVDDSVKAHETAAMGMISSGWEGKLADGIGAVHLVPVFPRPSSINIYTHALNKAAMDYGAYPFKRLDLQLIAMIDDAIEFCGTLGIAMEGKVLMCGFSASGTFSNRFTMLHPYMVRASAYGGTNGLLILPSPKLRGMSLNYPIGINNIKRYSSRFDIDSYNSVPQFAFMGENDTNDSVPNEDAYDKDERRIITGLFGMDIPKRWSIIQNELMKTKNAISIKTYANAAHVVNQEMLKDMVAFFDGYK